LQEKWNLKIGGRTLLFWLIHAMGRAKMVNDSCVAIPFGDAMIVGYCGERWIPVFTGSEDDVLDRFYQCAKLVKPSHIVRVTADCPLLTAEIIDLVVKEHLESRADYTANRLEEPMYPDGFDVEVFTYRYLELAQEASSGEDREHVTPWIKRNASKVHTVHCSPELLPWKDAKLSVDTQEDYERVVKWYEESKCRK
jgi:spore coat polysaccharide biosynthesis protein SpsF